MAKGDQPTKDGKFKGRKYECAICGFTFRKYEMIKQRGHWVCKKTCADDPGWKNRRK